MELSSAFLPLPGSSFTWTAHHSCLWCEDRWREFKHSCFSQKHRACTCACENQSNSTQVESVSNNDLIYACACPSFRERARECEKDKRENNKVRAGTGQRAAVAPARSVLCICVAVFVYVCLSVRWRRPPPLPPICPNSPIEAFTLEPLCSILLPGCIVFEVYSLTHTDCKWLATKRHHNSEIKKTREEAAVSSPCWSNQDKSLTKQPEMMLVVISVWINQHGSVIKYPLVILYIYVLTAATITTTGFGILEPPGHSMESEQNNSVVIIWRAYDCAVISEAVVTALFSPSASPYLHTHLHASCSLPHHHLCLHTKSSLRWRYMDSRVF